jgi:regulator of nucleoside diphosphate kinase
MTMRNHPIFVAENDAARLRELLAAKSTAVRDQDHLAGLAAELERALVLDDEHVPSDVITMNARARVLDLASGERRDLQLVFPWQADVSAGRISVLAPLGTALLGYRVDDQIEWPMPGGLRRLRIEDVSQLLGRRVPQARRTLADARA